MQSLAGTRVPLSPNPTRTQAQRRRRRHGSQRVSRSAREPLPPRSSPWDTPLSAAARSKWRACGTSQRAHCTRAHNPGRLEWLVRSTRSLFACRPQCACSGRTGPSGRNDRLRGFPSEERTSCVSSDQRHAQRARDCLSELLLHIQEVDQLSVVRLGPKVITILCADQFGRDPESISGSPYASLENCADAQLPANLTNIQIFPLERVNGRAGGDFRPWIFTHALISSSVIASLKYSSSRSWLKFANGRTASVVHRLDRSAKVRASISRAAPAAASSSASANSFAVGKRSPGSRAKDRRTASSIPLGTAALVVLSIGASWVSRCTSNSLALEPLNGGSPVSSSNRTQPRL